MIDQETVKQVIAYIDERRKFIERTDGRLHVLSRGPYLSAWDDVRQELADGAVQRWVTERKRDT